MKERSRLSAGNMLLLELLFAIVFFSLTLSVTLSVFGQAYSISKKAEGRTLAVAESNDIAEIIRSGSKAEEIENLFSLKGVRKESEGNYTMTYGDGQYRMSIYVSRSGRLYIADISCYAEGGGSAEEPLYQITVEHAVKTED